MEEGAGVAKNRPEVEAIDGPEEGKEKESEPEKPASVPDRVFLRQTKRSINGWPLRSRRRRWQWRERIRVRVVTGVRIRARKYQFFFRSSVGLCALHLQHPPPSSLSSRVWLEEESDWRKFKFSFFDSIWAHGLRGCV
ncbi:hypothetical protein Acr_05g0011540 [Actinidia rufa]|uniref:Uncharacterized protein n=1 Tax=Actinidia rufa TaxID=165716 RepID=A0A7J0EM12_9ERIC|nr:hypothetical protein Acr_05g0011540 [Actinidia rufa]